MFYYRFAICQVRNGAQIEFFWQVISGPPVFQFFFGTILVHLYLHNLRDLFIERLIAYVNLFSAEIERLTL
jgi:hypothetical protein